MNVLVTGSSGMLGTELCRRIQRDGHTVAGADVNCAPDDPAGAVDIRDFTALSRFAADTRPDMIFHLAAETNVDLCEQNPDHAFQTNALGTEHVALCAQKLDVPLVYISTAAVFDGSKSEAYTEYDAPNPINVYGRSKLAGEEAVGRLLRRYFIFRAGWMVGGWEIDKKFVYKIVQQILDGKREIQAVDDKFGSPTFTDDFVRNMMPIVQSGRFGLYHLCGKGCASRYEIARQIVKDMDAGLDVNVAPVPSSAFPLPAPRPRMEALRNHKLDLLGMNQMQSWRDNLRRYIVENLKHTHPVSDSVAARTC